MAKARADNRVRQQALEREFDETVAVITEGYRTAQLGASRAMGAAALSFQAPSETGRYIRKRERGGATVDAHQGAALTQRSPGVADGAQGNPEHNGHLASGNR